MSSQSDDLSDSASSQAQVDSSVCFRCPLCPSLYFNKYSLNRHVKTNHTEEEAYDCNLCGKRIPQRSSFLRHLKKHCGQRPFACCRCEKTYITNSDLSKHVRNAHSSTDQPPDPESSVVHRCAFCSKTFAVSTNLVIHEYTHLGHKPFACRFCQYKAGNLTNIRNHERSQHSKERPYSCSQCPKTFAENSALSKHMDTHSSARNYNCKLCDKSFKHKTSLSNHVKKSHISGEAKTIIKRSKNSPVGQTSTTPNFVSDLSSNGDEYFIDMKDINLNIPPETVQKVAEEMMSFIEETNVYMPSLHHHQSISPSHSESLSLVGQFSSSSVIGSCSQSSSMYPASVTSSQPVVLVPIVIPVSLKNMTSGAVSYVSPNPSVNLHIGSPFQDVI